MTRQVSQSEGFVHWAILGLIVLVGAWLRLHNLGLHEFERNHDEDIMALAVLGILQHGYPLTEGGMVYLRSTPLLYLMAWSAEAFGFSEFSLRLPVALFGTLLIPLTYWIVRRYWTGNHALAVAAVVATALWEVDVSRTARMYAPFAFFYTLTLYAICRGYLEQSQGWRWAAVPLMLVTILMHQLGFSLCAIFALAGIGANTTIVRRLAAIGTGVFGGLFFLYWDSVQSSSFYAPMANAIDFAAKDGSSVPSSVLGMIIGRLYTPEDIFIMEPTDAVYVLLGLGFCLCLATGTFLAVRFPDLRRPWLLLALGISFLAATLHQFLAAGLAFAAFVLLQGRGVAAVYRAPTLIVGAVLGTLFVGWFALAVSGATVPKLGLYETFRAFLDYPRAIVFRYFVVDRPFLALPAALGMAIVLLQMSRRRSLEPRGFLALAVIVALVLHGLFSSQFRPRYNFNVDPLYLMFATLGVWVLLEKAWGWWFSGPARRGQPLPFAFATVAAMNIVAFPDLRATSSFSHLGDAPDAGGVPWARKFRINRLEWPADRRSPAQFVAQRAAADAPIVSMDWITSYVYAGRVDYWLQNYGHFEDYAYVDQEGWRDIYLGSLVIPDRASLEAVAKQHCDSGIWLISSGWILEKQPNKLNEGIRQFLADYEGSRLHTGTDGLSSVYKISIPCGPENNTAG